MRCANKFMNPDNLNLLPQNLQVSKSLSSTLKTIKSLGVILTFMFVIFTLALVGFFIYSKITLDGVNSNIAMLTGRVKAQESSEQQLILLKDRLGKIEKARSSPNAISKVLGMNSLFEDVSTNIKFTDVSISPVKMDMSLNIYSNDDLTMFLQNLRNTKLFNQVELSSFNFSNSGYTMGVNLSQQTKQVQASQPTGD